jgi:hypothetical protein
MDTHTTKVLLTCRECGQREIGDTTGRLMNRIKMWNHVQRRHADRNIAPSQVRMLIREDNISRLTEASFRLQVVH